MTWNGTDTFDRYQSFDGPETRYQDVNWGTPVTQIVTPFTLNTALDEVTVGAQGVTGSASQDAFNGIIYRVLLIDGTNPAAAASMDMNPSDYFFGNSWTSATTGEKWELYGNAQVHVYT
ncbi:MAG: hypothetical protein IH795_02620 [Bacteroidetes bacterium]|nr:hypothetical protein [Bacteroidota bacterium]